MVKENLINLFGAIISSIALFITIYLQLKDPQTGVLLFLGIIGLIALYFIISYLISLFVKKMNQINLNTQKIIETKKDLNNLKTMFNLRGEISDLKSKMNVLELYIKKKKAQITIDPRWVILLLILLLLFLYLKSKGYF